jgi:MFS family permease
LTEESAGRLPPWAALLYRNFALLWCGQLVHTLGTWMRQTVQAWQLYELTNSPVAVGLLGLISAIPMLIFSLVGGAFADTMDRRRLIIVTQSVSLSLVVVLAALTTLGVIQPWMIYVIAFLSAVSTSFDAPARQSLTPSLVPPTHINNAVTLILTIRHLGLMVGPMVGGFLISWLGVAQAYWINVASYGALIAALLAMRLPPGRARGRPRVQMSVLMEGMRFMWSVPIIIGVLGIDFFTTFFGVARGLFPVFARDVFAAGPEGLGILAASPAVGGLLGVAALALGDVRRKGIGVLLCTLGFGVSIGIFAVAPTLLIACIGLAGYGFVDSLGDAMRNTLIQTETPDELRGRVNSAANMLSFGGPQIGMLWVGFLATALGPREGIGIGAALIVVFACGLVFFRPLIRYDALRSRARAAREPVAVSSG